MREDDHLHELLDAGGYDMDRIYFSYFDKSASDRIFAFRDDSACSIITPQSTFDLYRLVDRLLPDLRELYELRTFLSYVKYLKAKNAAMA